MEHTILLLGSRVPAGLQQRHQIEIALAENGGLDVEELVGVAGPGIWKAGACNVYSDEDECPLLLCDPTLL